MFLIIHDNRSLAIEAICELANTLKGIVEQPGL
jgi:hypothetical protein